MKDLVFISNNIPLPEELNGNTVNILNIVRQLKCRGYHITFYLLSNAKNIQYFNEFKHEVDELICIPTFPKYLFFLNYLRKRITIDSPAFFCNFNSGFSYYLVKSPKMILYAADSIAFQYSKQVGFIAKLRYYKLLLEESFLYRVFHKVIFVSPNDLMFSMLQNKNGLYIPIGYSEAKKKVQKVKSYDIIFSGNFNYYPNQDAFNYFKYDMFPSLVKGKKDIKICFVGRCPSTDMIEFAKVYPNNIFVTGEVEDVMDYLCQSRLYFSPLRLGSGMKNKILQAMISKLPIVCTSESITGVLEFNNNAVFVNDNASDFCNQILDLLRMKETDLSTLGSINYNTYKDNYTWSSIITKYYEPIFNSL